MKKILTSVWFTAGLGFVIFGATMAVLFLTSPQETPAVQAGSGGTNAPAAAVATEAGAEDEHHAETPPPPEEELPAVPLPSAVAEPGSLTFNNPDVQKLIEELQSKNASLIKERQELTELKRRAEFEQANLAKLTETLYQTRAEVLRAMTNQHTVVEAKTTNRLRQLAIIYTNMPPANAVAILDKMDVGDVARILDYMKEREKAAILENFATNTNTMGSRKATEISEQLRKLLPEPKILADPAAAPKPQ